MILIAKYFCLRLVISVTANINEIALLNTSSNTRYIDWPCGIRVEKQVRITFVFNRYWTIVFPGLK